MLFIIIIIHNIVDLFWILTWIIDYVLFLTCDWEMVKLIYILLNLLKWNIVPISQSWRNQITYPLLQIGKYDISTVYLT